MFDMMRQKLYSAVISDILDDLGYRNQVMEENIRPIHEDFVIVGKAKTCLAVDVYKEYTNPYDIEIKAIDSLKENEVFVASTNKSPRISLWGELLSTASKARGAVGAIIDGLIRDVKKIIAMDFPVFCAGFKPLDSKGRGYVIDYDCPILCGGVMVYPGDIIFADYDGVVVIPSQIAGEVIEKALEKVNKENSIKKELEEGKLLADIYKKYGVL
ncbi:MAG: RraA family protein [Clostridia bacterium]|nr:RraA family protein [Clostridia bacterium]